MSDRDALLAAIRAHPDEDTPRLVFADYLEENDEAPRAAFIRAQVEFARTPPWEPFAVRCRWRQPNVISGKPFRAELPFDSGPGLVSWAGEPFHRGFGWAIDVRTISLWSELAEPIFAREPVGKVNFWGGTLDAWRRIAASECVRSFRDLAFTTNPIEPLRALRDQPTAVGVTDLRFGRASGAGIPEVIEDLLQSPLGRAVRGLHFHTGYESLNELMDALNFGGSFERLSFSVMGMTADLIRRLFAGPAATELTELHLRDEQGIGGNGVFAMASVLPASLRDLELSSLGTHADGLEALAGCDRLAGLRRLNLSRNPLTPRAAKVLSLSHALAGLRALDLSGCRIEDKCVRHVTRAKFWRNLVELDLRKNPISAVGVKHLLDASVPADLTALVLDGPALGGDNRAALTRKFGDAIVFTASEVQGW